MALTKYRFPSRKTAVLQRRAERTPEVVQDIAWKAQKRLCERYRRLEARGKLKVKVCMAIARELAGFVWAIGQALPQPAARVEGGSMKTQCVGSRTGTGGRTLEAAKRRPATG